MADEASSKMTFATNSIAPYCHCQFVSFAFIPQGSIASILLGLASNSQSNVKVGSGIMVAIQLEEDMKMTAPSITKHYYLDGVFSESLESTSNQGKP